MGERLSQLNVVRNLVEILASVVMTRKKTDEEQSESDSDNDQEVEKASPL